MSPFKGFMFLAKEVANAVDKEQENRKDEIMKELTSLHRSFEQGELSDDEFDDREARLLDMLDEFTN
jgi:hypothetical protein